MVSMVGRAARQIVDFALPPRCLGCGTVTDGPHRFCVACWQSLTFLAEPCCVRCGLPFAYDGDAMLECGSCLAHPPSFDRMRAAVAYGDIARAVALKVKYSGKPGIAATPAHFMHRHLEGEDPASILTPVPLHRWRIWSRGYNQSALIATALAKRSGLTVELDLIRRIKATPPLRGMGRRARADTVSNVFALSGSKYDWVVGRTVILVDDVFTTGATVEACAKLLKQSGAAAVHILCWARVVSGAGD